MKKNDLSIRMLAIARKVWVQALILFSLFVNSSAIYAQTTIASDGLNNSTTMFTITGGAYYNGNSAAGDRPAATSFRSEGSHSRGITNGTMTMVSNAYNTSSYCGTTLTFDLAAWSIAANNNGVDPGDYVKVEISPDNGTNYYTCVQVTGPAANNAYWSYSNALGGVAGTATATGVYTGTNNTTTYAPANSNQRTTDGYSKVVVTNIPAAASIRIRITALTNSTAERWTIDNVILTGYSASVAGTISGGNVTVCESAVTTTALTLAGSLGTVQWQSSSDDITFSNISGANAASYTADNLNDLYYQAAVTMGACPTVYSSSTHVALSGSALTVIDGSRCGTGTVSLGVSSTCAITGETINWYAASSGGASLGTGTSYTTPSISATTTYYANKTFTAGDANVTATGSTSTSTGRGLVFNAYVPLTINSVQINTTAGTGTIVVALRDNAGLAVTGVADVTVNLTAGVNTVTLNWAVPVGNGYRMLYLSGGRTLTRFTTPSFTYQYSGALDIIGSYEGGLVTNRYNYFYNWSVSTSRIPVVATVVTPVTPSVSISASPSTICSGTSVTFTAIPTNGGSAPTYQWKLNGANVGIGGTTYSNSSLINGDVVSCVMTANNTCQTTNTATSNSITITITPPVTPSLTISTSTTTVCSGTSVTFTADPTNGGTTPAYQWIKNGTLNVGNDSPTFVITNLVNGDVISCQLTSNNACQTTSTAISNSITMTVTTSVTPTVSIAASSSNICAGTSVTFTATPTNDGDAPTYQWKLNGTNVGAGGTTYSNSALVNGDVVSCVMTANNTCQTTSTATSNSVTMTVTANVTPSLSIAASSSTICAGTSVTFTASVTNGGSTPSYQWKKNGTNVGTNSSTYVTALLSNNDVITCVVTANNTCQTTNTATSNSITMTVNPVLTPSIAISASATNICAGTSVTFTATPTNGGPSPSYQWKRNGSNVGTNSTTFTTSGLANNDVITCVMTANNTCQTTSTATSNAITMSVTANVTPSISIISSATAICDGTGVTFTANATNGGSTPSYQWYLNGNTVGTNSTSYSNSALANSDQVEVVLTANNVCQTTSSATSNIVTMSVTANVTPSVSIATTANNICAGTSVTFTATPTNGGTVPSYQWKLNGSNVGTNSDTYTSSSLANGDVVTCVLTANNPCQTVNSVTSNSQTISVISLVTFYLDDDADGYGDNSITTTGCTAPQYYTAVGGDCDDADPNINPNESEICDGIDNNCSGVADDGLSFTTYYIDADGDGYGSTSSGSFCQDPGAGYSLNNTDCDDANPDLYPNNIEICNDADDNCNSLIDDGITFTSYYSDLDFDGYGAGSGQSFCVDPGASYSLNNYDCDDTNSSVFPGATETCNGIDDNCDSSIDEGLLLTYYADADGDGYGAPSSSVTACSAPSGYSANNGDCNDTNAALNPATIWYEDADGDGYYGNTQVSCLSPGVTYSLTHGLDDCDDTHVSVNLGATEICDGLDNNCNGSIDEGVLNTYYLDSDADGYGVVTSYVQACTVPSGYSAASGDCDDASATSNPGATETCNGVDDNCDGVVDEGCPSTVAGEEPYNALYQPAYFYSYCANFYGSLDGAAPSSYAHSSCITGEDKWYTFTATSEGVTIYVGSYVNDIVIELQDASGNLVDVENAVSGIGTEIMNYYGLTSGQGYRVGIRNYNSGLSAGGTFSGCIRQLKRGGSDSGGGQWPSTISTCNIFKATYAGGTSGVQYRYTFTGLTGVAAGNVYTKTQNSDYLSLTAVSPTLPSGCTYSVLVTTIYTIANGAGVNEVINAPALTPTTITVTADPATQLRAADQQANGPRFRGAVVGSLPWVCGISNWRWRFTEVNPVTHAIVGIPIEVNRGAASNFINIGTVSQLQYGKTYAVQTAPVFTYTGTNYNWGPVAYMSIIGTAGMVIEDNSAAQSDEAQVRTAQEQQLELAVYPNPSNGSDLMMSISGTNLDNGVVRVMDAMGRVVYQNRVTVQGVLQTQLPLRADLANGIYVLQVIGNHERAETRFIIEK